jgi:hypothetical protein
MPPAAASTRALLLAGALVQLSLSCGVGAVTPMPEPVVKVSEECSFSCALAKIPSSGGTVFVPNGTWLSPPVNLTSHLHVYLAAGAVLKVWHVCMIHCG